ncbi:hypothetical protein KGF56_002091 [Candida oxycetoniae]|uniref:Short-chain dehydrogenase/reductase 3 n=1 Tax=Candida oxycetoniae TaxID=497107 RepID=A0AAI9WYK5_9ASCO|nr:uncharacterized protein KGF56_002091 [Candida oxycetoniae]KAI3405135.2 hypothetical protein KGF56_002091 [Candida oxycetoniae]
MLFLVTLFINCSYWLNRKFRILSELLIGNIYEPKIDIVLVTGGTNGLGREIVLQLASREAKVVVLDLIIPADKDKVPGVVYFKCDVSNRQQVLDAQREINRDVGVVTVLINNAGIATGKTVLDLSFQEIERTIQINLISSFYTIKAFLPSMMLMKRGYIVTIASILGYMSPARLSAYGASKSGLIALHESLTYELGPPSLNPHGVKTLLICPGQLKTGMFTGVKTPSTILAPELDPKFVAAYVVSAIEQGRRGEIKLPLYGKFIPLVRAFPWPLVELTRKLSGIDQSMVNFKNKLTKVASNVSSIASRSLQGSSNGSPVTNYLFQNGQNQSSPATVSNNAN